jgi:hypothetical protein
VKTGFAPEKKGLYHGLRLAKSATSAAALNRNLAKAWALLIVIIGVECAAKVKAIHD